MNVCFEDSIFTKNDGLWTNMSKGYEKIEIKTQHDKEFIALDSTNRVM